MNKQQNQLNNSKAPYIRTKSSKIPVNKDIYFLIKSLDSLNNGRVREQIKSGLTKDQEAQTNYFFFNEKNTLFEDKTAKEQSYAFESKESAETAISNMDHDLSFNCQQNEEKINVNLFQWDEDIENKDKKHSDNTSFCFDQNEKIDELIARAREQNACRELQEEIINKPQLATKYIVELMKYKVSLMELIVDPFGNYFIQRIISIVNESEKKILIEVIRNDFVSIAQNFYGTRVLQNLISSIRSDALIITIKDIICLSIPSMITNIISSHIVFNLLSLNNKSLSSDIYKSVQSNIIPIAYDKHGSCSIQKIIQNDPLMTNDIIIELIMNCVKLLTNEFGHYTIRFIFTMKNPYFNFNLIKLISPYFLELANNKFSSTVLEKCFEICDENSKQFLYRILCNYQNMQILLVNEYGNYVLQKAIDNAEPNIQGYLFQFLPTAMLSLKRDTFGKQLFSIMCTKYPNVKAMVNYLKGKKKQN